MLHNMKLKNINYGGSFAPLNLWEKKFIEQNFQPFRIFHSPPFTSLIHSILPFTFDERNKQASRCGWFEIRHDFSDELFYQEQLEKEATLIKAVKFAVIKSFNKRPWVNNRLNYYLTLIKLEKTLEIEKIFLFARAFCVLPDFFEWFSLKFQL